MIISHNKKFVMLEPWKTASQTMRARLHEHSECESRYPGFFYFNPYLNRVVHQHITRAEFDCLPEAKLGYLTAAFVRNPYDRVNSGFRQLQKDIQEQPSALFGTMDTRSRQKAAGRKFRSALPSRLRVR